MSFSTFGHPPGERAAKVQDAVRILDQQRVDFEYDGEMAADVALNPDLMAAYPFCRLSGPANVLVMPAFHSAAISTKMLQELGGATVIGPLLVGLDNSVQIVNLSSKDTDLVNMAALAAYNVERVILHASRSQHDTKLTGVIAAVATAVDETGAPDAARSTKLARFLLDTGCDGLNVLGTTGEATSFSLEQRKARDDRPTRRPGCRSTG